MCASPQCHELSLQPKQAVVLKFLHELCILVAAGIDSRALLIRNLARHRAHSGADRPRSSNLIPASPLPASPLPLVSQRPMQNGSAATRELSHWPLPASVHTIAAGSLHRQPHASAACICCASLHSTPCARRRSSTTQCDSRTGFALPSVLHWSIDAVQQQPPA